MVTKKLLLKNGIPVQTYPNGKTLELIPATFSILTIEQHGMMQCLTALDMVTMTYNFLIK